MPRTITLAICSAALLLSAAGVARGPDVTVAAASDLQAVMPLVTAKYRQATGRTVKIAFGSSGNFFTQIQSGAPFDLFFSADIDYPKTLAQAGLADPGSLYVYAHGRLALWTRRDSGIDISRGLAAIADPRIRRIAIANPQHAPYGRAAVAALQQAHVYDAVRARLVFGENISQAAQFVESGNAEVGILALSIALAPAVKASGTYVILPPTAYPPIEQAAVVLSAARNKRAAGDFLAFIRRPEIVEVFREYGFAPGPTEGRAGPPEGGHDAGDR